MSELSPALISEIQKHTGFPWWNGHAYAESKGYPQKIKAMNSDMGRAVDDLFDLMEVLRAEKNYEGADRLRTIIGRLARARTAIAEDSDLVRTMAKDWK